MRDKKLNGKVVSIIEDSYQLERAEEKGCSHGATALIETDEGYLLELGINGEGKVKDMVAPKGDQRQQYSFFSIYTPVFRNKGENHWLDVCTEPEKSFISLICSSVDPKVNKRGLPMTSRSGKLFVTVKKPLITAVWLESEIASAPEVESITSSEEVPV